MVERGTDTDLEQTFRFEESVGICDVCREATLRSVHPAAHIMECAHCGYRFTSPRPSQAEIAEAYSDPHFYDGWVAVDEGRLAMWNKRFDVVEREARGKRLLDIGAGLGTFLAIARDRAGWEVMGTEVSSSAVKAARDRHGIDLIQGQAEDLPLQSEHFDVVTLWHVLEHVPSPSRLLKLCHDVLVPGGILVVGVPNDEEISMAPRWAKSLPLRVLGRPTMPRYERPEPGHEIHLSHFRERVLRRLLEKQGFRIRYFSVDDHYPVPTWRSTMEVEIYRSIRRITGLNMGIAILVVAERV